MYKSYFKENFPYIQSHTASDEFNVERILSLNEEQLLREGLIRKNGQLMTEAGAIGNLLGAAAKGAAKLGGAALKAGGKMAVAAGKSIGKALIAAVKAAVVSVGKDLADGIKKTATKYTPQLAKLSTGMYQKVEAKLKDKLAQPKGLETNIVPVANELFNDMKPVLSKISQNPEMDQKAWANFLGIMTLDFLQQIVAPTLASKEGEEPNLNEIKGLRQAFEKALYAKFQPMIKQAETQAKKPEQKQAETPKQTDFKFDPVTGTGAPTGGATTATAPAQ